MSNTKPVKKNRIKTILKNYDWVLIVIVAVLLLFGLIMLYSTSSYNAQLDHNDAMYYVKKQIVSIILGLGCMFVVSIFTKEFIHKASRLVFVLSLFMVVLVLTPLGYESHGARRWLDFGVITVQPSEIVKITLILFTAYLICKYSMEQEKKRLKIKEQNASPYLTKKEARELELSKKEFEKLGLKNYAKTLAATLIAAAMVVLITDDLGTGIIILAIGFVMIAVTYKNKKHLIYTVILFVILAVAVILLESFRMDRIRAWWNPDAYATDEAYQILQGLYAIGSGGVVGKGLGMSTQKLGFIPESQNDMIFSIICEELGIIGGILVLALFAVLIYKMKKIFDASNNIYDKLIVVGVITHLAVQTIINIAVVTNTIPNTGVPLPFISYGGTAVLFQLAEIGLVLGVSARNTEEIDSTISFAKVNPKINNKGEYGYR